jgi:hypothetical protein
MNRSPLALPILSNNQVSATANYIVSIQAKDGCIAWFKDGHMDPWDHTEAAMGLASCGRIEEAMRAYDFLAEMQTPTGGWYATYEFGKPKDQSRMESNFIAYVATGIWHLYLVTQNRTVVERYWAMVEQAVELVIDMQGPMGEICWAIDSVKGLQEDALVTGSSSIYHSLGSAISLAKVKRIDCSHWVTARAKLKRALIDHPEAFDRTWESKARFSMDWFYPVLTGVLTGDSARERINERWDEFVVDQLGCRCVNDEPWVTVAESCELVMALMAIGDRKRATEIFQWIQSYRDNEGAYWTGYVFRDQAIWPEERTTWTAAAVLLAADALDARSNAYQLFGPH